MAKKQMKMTKRKNQTENKLIKSDIKLTIGILVSNRIQYIRKTMESLQPLLRELPSELIAVDTKGTETDGSIEVVREYTDKIYPFVWCNDFAAARNVCMEHAKGEWFLYLDDDEWFEDVTEIIEFFKSGECENYQSAFFNSRDYDVDGTYSTAVTGRMIRRRENTRFIGRVHEGFNEVYSPFRRFSCFTHHYGYAFPTLEDAQKHRERNASILRGELEARGELPNLCAQMVQELIYLEDTAEEGYTLAVDFLKRNNNPMWMQDSCAQWIMVSTVRYFIRKKEYEKAKEQWEYLKKNYLLNKMSQMALHGILAGIALEEQDKEQMLSHAEQYVKLFDWKLKHEEDAMVQMNLDIPKYAQPEYYVHVVKIGAVAASQLGKKEQMNFFLERLPESEKKPVQDTETRIDNVSSFQLTVCSTEERKKSPKLIKSDIKLTIGMLVSNHIQYIRKTMESIKPLLQAVPSELVVLDTMGDQTDGSIEIVKEYTDKIYPFIWCNDFSAARNACLDHAKGEWFLYLDDDEWFDDVQEFIDFFQNRECEEYYSGYYYTRDYLPDGGYSVGIAGRMVRRTVNTCFVGKVHEGFNEVFAPNKQFNCFTHHYGYAYANEEEREKKQRRNVGILRAEMEQEGLTPRNAAQMAQELLSCGATREEGYQFCLDSIEKLEQQSKLKDTLSQWLLIATVRSLAGSGISKFMERAEYIYTRYELTPIAQMVLAATVILVAKENDYELVKKYSSLYLKNWDWKKEHEDEALLQINLDFPRFLTKEIYCTIIHKCAVLANQNEDFLLANQLWKCLPWENEEFDGSRYAVDFMITTEGLKRLQEEKQEQLLRKQREAAQQEIIAMLKTLLEAGEYTIQTVQQGQFEALGELLSGMQELAITIGQKIDEQLGEGTKAVSALEMYCELLWQCSQAEEVEVLLEGLRKCNETVRMISL